MVVALEHHVDVVLVEDGGQLGPEDHAVRVGVIQAGAVDVLVDGDDPPGGVGIRGNGLPDGLLMLRHIVIVGVQHDEQAVAVEVVIVAAGLGGAVLRGVGVVEVVHIVGIQGVVVADGGGHRQRGQHVRAQIAGVLLLLGLAGLVDLVAGGDDEAHIRVLGQGGLQGPVPAEGVVPGGGVGRAGLGGQGLTALGLALGGTDLGIAHIQHLHGVEAPGLVGLHLRLDAVLLHGVVVGGVGRQAGDSDVVVVIGHAAGEAGVHVAGGAGVGPQAVPIGAEVHHRSGGGAVVLAVPGEVQLRLVGAGGQGHLGVVGGDRVPLLGPGGPLGAAAHGGTVVVVDGGGQGGDHSADQQCAAHAAHQKSLLDVHVNPSSFSVLFCAGFPFGT